MLNLHHYQGFTPTQYHRRHLNFGLTNAENCSASYRLEHLGQMSPEEIRQAGQHVLDQLSGLYIKLNTENAKEVKDAKEIKTLEAAIGHYEFALGKLQAAIK